jgi:ADP-heptose:LPS heptosyltransferase
MKSSLYREKWRGMQPAPPSPEALTRLARQIASSFMDAHLDNGHYESDYVDLLCEMATFSEAQGLHRPAAQALFSVIVEGLCDEFEDLQTETYNRVMAQVISYCRRLPAAAHLHRRLGDYGIATEADLLARVERVRRNHRRLSPRDPVRRVLLLSRVTIGADVAITSVILQRLRRFFPEAEFVFIGGAGLREIYGGLPSVRFQEVSYRRNGGLLERLETWHRVLAVVEAETGQLPAEAVLLVDSDSRLSQLGILPLIDLPRYLFFSSRSASEPDAPLAMAEICNGWLDAILGEKADAAFCYPRVWLPPAPRAQAASIRRNLSAGGARRVVTLNFGVGGNRRKRVGGRFEEKLLRTLLAEPDTVVLLDQGSGEEEQRQALALLEAVRAAGFAGREAEFAAGLPAGMRAGLAAVRTRIGEMAALIAESDEYIGYDSAGQHIAAAVGTPCITVFAGSNNRRFIRRWRALGPSPCQIVHADTLSDPEALDIDDLITRVANARRQAGRPPRGAPGVSGALP